MSYLPIIIYLFNSLKKLLPILLYFFLLLYILRACIDNRFYFPYIERPTLFKYLCQHGIEKVTGRVFGIAKPHNQSV